MAGDVAKSKGTAAATDFVEVDISTMIDLVNDETAGVDDVTRVFGDVGRGTQAHDPRRDREHRDHQFGLRAPGDRLGAGRDKSFRPVINVTHDAHVAVVRPEEAGCPPGC